jgi:hypothetical protein
MRNHAVLLTLVLLCTTGCATNETSAEAQNQPANKLAKPAVVTREEWGSEPQPLPDDTRHTPKYITIHHGGVDWKAGRDPAEFVRGVQKWGQRERNWPDLPYHYMIAPDGRVFECRPLEYAPQSNTKYDLPGHVGIELMGNFQSQRPSAAQLKSLVAIAAWVAQEYEIDLANIAGHGDVAQGQTSCPGKDLDRYIEDGSIVGWVKQTLAGEDPGVKPGEPLPGGPTVVVDTPAEPATTTKATAPGE